MDQFVYLPCTTPALPKGISVLPVLLVAMEVLLRGEWKGKGHVSLLFAFQSLKARWISTLTRSLSFSFHHLPLVATHTAL